MASTRLIFMQSLSISVGMAFANSCFSMVAGMASTTGAWVLAAIAGSVLLASGVAHAIGRLAKRFPSALGIRTYLKAAFGNTTSLFFVFLYLFMITLIAGVESNMYASIVRHVMPTVEPVVVIAGVFLTVLAANVFGYEFTKGLQLAMVTLMFSGVLALSWYGIGSADLPAASAALASHGGDPLAALPAAVVTAFFLFVGFEFVTSSQAGSRGAAAQLPKVLLGSVLLLGFVYLSFSAAALAHLDHAALTATNKPQMLLAQKLWGTSGSWIMLAVSTCAVMTAFNAGVLGAARLLYALAREGFLPPALGTTAAFSGAPVVAIAATIALSLAVAIGTHLTGAAYLLGGVAAVLITVCYCALLAASLKLHRVPAAAGGRGWQPAQLAEAVALLMMVLLLAALVLSDASFRPAAFALAAALVLLILAVFAHRRGERNKNALRPGPAGVGVPN